MNSYIKTNLYVEQGNPYTGEVIPLNEGSHLIGRKWADSAPEIAFSSQRISRRHALIEYDGMYYTIIDQGSKGGTKINGSNMMVGIPYRLVHGDSINLSNGTVIFNVVTSLDPGETFVENMSLTTGRFIVDIAKREVLLDGKPLDITGKRFDTLALLVINIGRAVHEEEIKCRIWPESVMAEGTSDQDSNAVKRVIHDIRAELGEHREIVLTKRGFGYLLNVDYLKALNATQDVTKGR